MLRQAESPRLFILSLLLLPAFFLSACQRAPTMVSGETMGTTYAVVVAGSLDADVLLELEKAVEKRLQEINQSMSTYIEDSEISLFNRARSIQWYPVSKELAMVVGAAQEVSRLSQGAFDITVGSLVDLWGFGPGPGQASMPGKAKMRKEMRKMNYRYVAVRETPPAIRKRNPDVQIDLSAIAKGYAVDELARLLRERNLMNYLVEIGGELRAQGVNSEGKKWRVGIKDPRRQGQPIKSVDLRGAIATSGDYYNFREMEGQKFSHQIDTKTGYPLAYQARSVSVIAASAMQADAWSTALFVLGEKKGYALARQLGLAAYFTSRSEDESMSEQWTEAFSEYF